MTRHVEQKLAEKKKRYYHLRSHRKKNKAGYTATKVTCGWAGAVMKYANSSIWAGAVTLDNAENAKKANGDRPSDRST